MSDNGSSKEQNRQRRRVTLCYVAEHENNDDSDVDDTKKERTCGYALAPKKSWQDLLTMLFAKAPARLKITEQVSEGQFDLVIGDTLISSTAEHEPFRTAIENAEGVPAIYVQVCNKIHAHILLNPFCPVVCALFEVDVKF